MATSPPAVFVVHAKPWTRFWRLLRQAGIAAYEDNCFGIAKGIAYSGLLALFPVLTSIAAILLRVNAEPVSRALARFLFEVTPPGSEELIRYQFTVKGQRPVWLVVTATLVSIWAASGAMMSLMEGFQAAYRLPGGRSFLKQRGVAILLVFIGAVPAIGASFLIVFGARLENRMFASMGIKAQGGNLTGWAAVLSVSARYFVAFACVVLVTGLVYYFGPNRPMKLKRVWPGAILATVLWVLATSGFGWYVRNLANYNVMYGSIAAVIVLLVWIYLMSIIGLFGCEFNAERERLRPVWS
jgi:membrane protein